MARKRKQEEHVNHERWLVSYADFITLLFAFFVVMYAISSVNEGKYRVLSDSLVSAFSNPPKAVSPLQQQGGSLNPIVPRIIVPINSRSGAYMPSSEQIADMQKLSDELLRKLSKLEDKDMIGVTKTNEGVEIVIKSNLLFLSGDASLSRSAIVVLQEIASVLRSQQNEIHVEGYTDNVPINSPIFPSNWELSAARAASVLRALSRDGVDPAKMKAVGYGEHKPIAGNETTNGRSKNRRVVILVRNAPAVKRQNLMDLDRALNRGETNKIGSQIEKAVINRVLDNNALGSRRLQNDSLVNPVTSLPQAIPVEPRQAVTLPRPQLLPLNETPSKTEIQTKDPTIKESQP
ncbi:MAG: flagellar motor protein MotD [Gammaproteobacteria bacterium]|nr:flagellar motor protein MotD [Gammaproteobacteria bacterium]MDH5802633.1 flagellar motor protein MotD [Gammaproteobacteria bacterium]